MKTITISLSDSTADETVEAEYFQIEDGWVTFKTQDHKAVVAYPEKRVTRIKSEADSMPSAARAWEAGVRYMAGLFDGEDLLPELEKTNPYEGVQVIPDAAVEAAVEALLKDDKSYCECRHSTLDKHDVNPPCSTRTRATEAARSAIAAAARG